MSRCRFSSFGSAYAGCRDTAPATGAWAGPTSQRFAAGRPASRHTGPWKATTPNPILLLNNTFDPNSPFPNACVDRATGRPLVNLPTPPRRTVRRSDRLPFDSNFGQPLRQQALATD